MVVTSTQHKNFEGNAKSFRRCFACCTVRPCLFMWWLTSMGRLPHVLMQGPCMLKMPCRMAAQHASSIVQEWYQTRNKANLSMQAQTRPTGQASKAPRPKNFCMASFFLNSVFAHAPFLKIGFNQVIPESQDFTNDIVFKILPLS